jgi:vesicle coat complex subunit
LKPRNDFIHHSLFERWGQIFILDAIATYNPRDAKEAEAICERVVPRLTHVNASVVVSSIRVVTKMLDFVTPGEVHQATYRKIGPPMVTLLSSEPEVQYVALRNMNLILRKHPDILNQDMRVFFCKYNDPLYVKLEKLEIIVKLASDKNIDQILTELKE